MKNIIVLQAEGFMDYSILEGIRQDVVTHKKEGVVAIPSGIDISIIPNTTPQWIPADTPPKEGVSVITVDENGVYAIDTYEDGDWFNFPGDVVAWMPIPEWEGEK